MFEKKILLTFQAIFERQITILQFKTQICNLKQTNSETTNQEFSVFNQSDCFWQKYNNK